MDQFERFDEAVARQDIGPSNQVDNEEKTPAVEKENPSAEATVMEPVERLMERPERPIEPRPTAPTFTHRKNILRDRRLPIGDAANVILNTRTNAESRDGPITSVAA